MTTITQVQQTEVIPVSGLRPGRLVACPKCETDNRAFLQICLQCGTLLSTTMLDRKGLSRRVVGSDEEPLVVVYELD